jgi:hypothetical protein
MAIDDRLAVNAYREQARALRASASQHTDRRMRNAALGLADEYEWRAASLEAAIALHSGAQAHADAQPGAAFTRPPRQARGGL